MKPSSSTPLTALGSGQKGTVTQIDGGRRMIARLADLGILPGTDVLVITNLQMGPMLLEVRGTRYTLGRGIVDRILVAV
jgi:Fe2+ transport system protein FeoA